MKIGFMINPRAGEGLFYRTNGSDRLSTNSDQNYSISRAMRFLDNLNRYYVFLTASGNMGEDALLTSGFDNVEVIYKHGEVTDRQDTINFVREAEKRCDIILFAGGDGTAGDILSVNPQIPILGIPAGMKMYSSVFAKDPEEAAELLDQFDSGKAVVVDSLIEDADEDKMMEGKLLIKRIGTVRSISSETHYHDPKIVSYEWTEDSITEYVKDTMDSSYYLMGTGTTCKRIMENMGMNTSMFSVDLIKDKKLIKSNYFPEDLDKFVKDDAELKIIVSHYAGSGFFLGRGNRQIDAMAIRRAGKKNIIIISSETKLSTTKGLRFDVDGISPDFFGKYVKVIVGYERFRMIPVL